MEYALVVLLREYWPLVLFVLFGGFLGGLLAKFVRMAIQEYVRVNFGNPPGLLQRLSPAVRDWLLKGHHGRVAFLWDARGLALTWRTPHIEPEEVAGCAEYGVVLAELLREAKFLGAEITDRDPGDRSSSTSS